MIHRHKCPSHARIIFVLPQLILHES
jgi:hypothetical protein